MAPLRYVTSQKELLLRKQSVSDNKKDDPYNIAPIYIQGCYCHFDTIWKVNVAHFASHLPHLLPTRIKNERQSPAAQKLAAPHLNFCVPHCAARLFTNKKSAITLQVCLDMVIGRLLGLQWAGMEYSIREGKNAAFFKKIQRRTIPYEVLYYV